MTTLTLKALEGESFALDLDQDIKDQLGERANSVNFKVLECDDLDDDAVKELTSVNVEDLETLAKVLNDQPDSDVVSAAIILNSGNMGYVENTVDAFAWMGDRGQDEKDYVAYAIEEGLIGKETLKDYFDFKAYGKDLLMDRRHSEVDRKLIVWNKD